MKKILEMKIPFDSFKKQPLFAFFYAMMILLLTGPVYGQRNNNKTPQQRADEVTQWMKTNLNLDEKQVADVKSINLKYAVKNAELQQSTSGKKQKMQALKGNETARDAELKPILTAEQYQTWQTKKAELKHKAKEKAKQKKSAGE